MSEHLERVATAEDHAENPKQPAERVIHVEGETKSEDDLLAGFRADAAALRGDQRRIMQDSARALLATGNDLGSFKLKPAKLTGEFVPEPTAKPRHPAVRIVHRGGPARNATVYINGHEAETATRVEIVLDGNHEPGVYARIEFVGRPPIESANVQLDVAADDAVIVEAKPARFFWPVLLGLVVDAIPAGLAWWTWELPGALAGAVFVLSVMFGVVWTFGVLVALVGYGRVMAATERAAEDDGEDASDAEPECECEQ